MKRPKVGDLVEITWVDSGLETQGHAPGAVSLDIAKTRGRVLSLGPCSLLARKVPLDFPCEVIVLEMCSSQPTIGTILWRDVVKVKKMK